MQKAGEMRCRKQERGDVESRREEMQKAGEMRCIKQERGDVESMRDEG